jgi:hypothetical protein
VGRVLVGGGGEEEAPLLPLHAGPVVAPPDVRDVDVEARGPERPDDPVARLRHPAAVGRVVLRDDERPHAQLSPNPAPPSSTSASPPPSSSNERAS